MKNVTAWGVDRLVRRRNDTLRNRQVSLVRSVQRKLHDNDILVEIHAVKLTVHVQFDSISTRKRSPLNCVHKGVESGDPTIIRCDQHIDTSDLPRLAGRTEAPRQASDTTICISIRQL